MKINRPMLYVALGIPPKTSTRYLDCKVSLLRFDIFSAHVQNFRDRVVACTCRPTYTRQKNQGVLC